MVGNNTCMNLPTDKKREIVLKALSGKFSISSIAKEYGVSRKAIYSWVKRYKLKKLAPQYKKGRVHPREYSHTFENRVIRIVKKNPSLSISDISKHLKVGRHAVYNLLSSLKLTTEDSRIAFCNLYAFPGVLSSDIKVSVVRAVIAKETSITKIAKENNVARKTVYKWIEEYKSRGSIDNKYVEGLAHPRSFAPEVEKSILAQVVRTPEVSIHALAKATNHSIHGVFNVLKRYSLTYKDARIAYANSHAEELTPVVAPSGFWQGIKNTFTNFITPNLAPAPPPSISSTLKTFIISFFSSLTLSLISIWWTGIIFSAPNVFASVGMIFALMALSFGMFFFFYSLKYYISLAIVLSHSQNEGLDDGKKNVVGLKANLDDLKLEKQPFVSVHVALYNEKNVVERLSKAVTSFDYPNYEVILADDSTDETSDKIRAFQESFLFKGEKLRVVRGNGWTLTEVDVREGVTFKHLHRTTRSGYKGAALDLALQLTDKRAEYISIFDADFVPYSDSLSLFLKYFQIKNDTRTAAVQGYQWHVLNKSENWITRGVRSEYAGSYVIERAGTEIYNGLKQISGSVYMIKKSVLQEIGWGRSITEDFELTLKLYQKGYKVVYTPYIQAPAECVSTLKRLVRQRMRWAEGHSFNIKKMLLSLLTSPKLSFAEKFEAVYLAPYYLQAMFFLVGTMSWLLSETVFRVRLPFWVDIWGWSLVLTNMISLPLLNSVGMFLEESERKDYSGIPSFVALSYIVVPFQAYAALKGFLEKSEGPWFRTPKTGKVTDIFTRNKFYRFIQGIMPGSEGTSFSVDASPYLSLATANNRFDDFQIKPKGAKWIGKVAVVGVLLVSITLNSFAFWVKPVKAAGWYNNSWLYRVKITVDNTKVDADLTGFPVYVDLSNMPAGFHTHVNQTDARDIRVTKDDGTTEVPREIVFYTAASDTGELHFKGDLANSTDTEFYIYYGNSSASDYALDATYGAENVWDSNYVQVQHLNETSGTHLDKTANDNDSNGITVTQQGTASIGKMYGADDFDGTDDIVTFPDATSLKPTGDMTLETWIKMDNLPSTRSQNATLINKNGASTEAYMLYVSTSNKPLFKWSNTTPTNYYSYYNTALSTGTWYHLVGVKDGSTMRFYFNGSTTGTITGSPTGTIYSSTGSTLKYGSPGYSGRLDGIMDEIRFSNIARSATWISTEYNNQSAPSTFIKTWGAEEDVPELTILLFPLALAAPFVVKYMKRRKEAMVYA